MLFHVKMLITDQKKWVYIETNNNIQLFLKCFPFNMHPDKTNNASITKDTSLCNL